MFKKIKEYFNKKIESKIFEKIFLILKQTKFDSNIYIENFEKGQNFLSIKYCELLFLKTKNKSFLKFKKLLSEKSDRIEKHNIVIIPTLHAGSSAFSNLLNLHPKICVTPKLLVDKYLDKKTNVFFKNRNFIKTNKAFVIHKQPGNPAIYNKSLWNEKINLIKKISSTNKFFQIIRDPLNANKSNFFHLFYRNSLLPWQKFKRKDNPTLINLPIDINLEKKEKFNYSNLEFYTLEKPSLKKVNLLLKEAKPFTQKYTVDEFEFTKIYLKFFKQYEILSMEDFVYPNIHKNLNLFFNKLNISRLSRNDNFFFHKSNNSFNRILYHSFIRTFYKNYKLDFSIYISGLAINSLDLNFIELKKVAAPKNWSNLDKNIKYFSLVCDLNQWLKMPYHLRSRLFNSDLLDFFLINNAIPIFYRLVNYWHSYFYIPVIKLNDCFKKEFNLFISTKHKHNINNLLKKNKNLEKNFKSTLPHL